jgi:ribosomal protein S18 acetylase RimI-like enzyme
MIGGLSNPKSAVSIALRPTLPSDYTEIASWISDADACMRWAGPRVPFPFSYGELATLLAVAGGESYCLFDGGASACGFGQHWVLTPGSVHLGRIIVSPALRGRGFGRQLCQHLIARAIEATGATAVTLRVYRDNPAAIALYSSLGFVPVEVESAEEVLFMRMPGQSVGKANGSV